MNDRDRFLDSFALLLQRRKSYEISKRQRNKTTINVRSMHERHYRHCHEQRGDYFTVSTNAFDKDEVKKQTSRERESGKKGIEKKKKKSTTTYRGPTKGGLTLMCTHIPIVILAPYTTSPIYTDNVHVIQNANIHPP